MLGIPNEKPMADGDNKIFPLSNHGVKIMSMGFLVDEDSPVIWRGPMVMRALVQFLGDTLWGELDYLVLDLPPGTGDAQLTIVQQVSLAGAVIVTTPQDIALLDARKGLQMFRKTDVPILGIIETVIKQYNAEDFSIVFSGTPAYQYHVEPKIRKSLIYMSIMVLTP